MALRLFPVEALLELICLRSDPIELVYYRPLGSSAAVVKSS